MRKIATPLFLVTLFSHGLCLASEPVTYYSDIRPVIEQKCLACHTESGVSFSFEDPETTYQYQAAISNAVAEKRMPPWLAEAGHQEYVGDYSLSAEQLALFERWTDNGYILGEPQNGTVSGPVTVDFEAALTLDVQPDFAYLPNQSRKDDYRCFLVDWPYQETRYVTGFKAEPGNLKIAHHLVLFAVSPDSAALIHTLSEEEEGPGHQCFGGVVPDKVADNDAARDELEQRFPGGWDALSDDYYWLAHWAPGLTGFEFPENTGVLVEPGSVLVVQMHYYSAYAPGETDGNTRMLFQLAEEVEKPSINYPMTNDRWLDADTNESMVIPAGESRTYEVSNGFQGIMESASDILNVDEADIAGIELRSANLHMHAYGASGRISLRHPSGQKETLLNVPRWDLDWQRDFEFTAAKSISPEQFGRTALTVECTFENYSEETVVGGYGSYDEMCFNFSYVSLVKKAPMEGGSDEQSVASK